jgi:hypothetical protein
MAKDPIAAQSPAGEWKPGGGRFGGAGASGSWVLAHTSWLSESQVPQEADQDVEALRGALSSIRLVPMESSGDDAFLVITLDSEKAGGRQALPRQLTVGVSGSPKEFNDLWYNSATGEGSGVYVLPVQVPSNGRSSTLLGAFEQAATGRPHIVQPDFGLTIQTVTCPPGCRSIIFGSPCTLCVSIKVDLTIG